MTELRQRFTDDLRLGNYAPRTIETYVGRVAAFARHFGRSPDVLGMEEVRAFQLYLLGQHVSWSTFNQSVCALRFLYGITLGRPDQLPLIPFGKWPKTLPCVLSPEEVARLLEAAEPGRDGVLLATTYACGLRLGEVLSLKAQDIDSSRMVVQVRQGKGAKDRLVPLALQLHVHCVCTGGGLSCNERGEVDAQPCWRSCRPGFFLPVRVLSRVFRGKYLERLRQLHGQGKLKLPARLAALADASAFAAWLKPLYGKDWVVYAKRPFGGPAQVLRYLARYTHRVAISNARLLKLHEGKVTFRYKDYADGHGQKTMTLSAEEFLRRFVQHVLPKGFVKIRHYGLLANRHRQEKLALCRRLLLPLAAGPLPDPATADAEPIAPAAVPHCPQCGGCRFVRIELPRDPSVASSGRDTS